MERVITMRKTTFSLLFIAIVLVCTAAGQEPNSRESLRGLSTVPVKVQMAQGQAFLAEQVQKFIELRLRLAGINVPSNKATLRKEGNAALFVTLLTDGLLFVRVELKQYVFLKRRPTIQTYERTWNLSSTNPTIPHASEDEIKADVGKKLDEFIKDYLAVNPKRRADIEEKKRSGFKP